MLLLIMWLVAHLLLLCFEERILTMKTAKECRWCAKLRRQGLNEFSKGWREPPVSFGWAWAVDAILGKE